MSEQPGIVAAGGWCAPSETIHAMARREALWWGRATPTEEEKRVEIEKLNADFPRDMEAWAATQQFLRDLERYYLPSAAGLAKAVLTRHARGTSNECVFCETDGQGVEWPCPDAYDAIRDLGLQPPDEPVYDKPVEPVPDPDNPHWPFPKGPVDPLGMFPAPTVSRGGVHFDTGGAHARQDG